MTDDPNALSSPLDILEYAVQSIDGTGELEHSARRAFRLLEPWCLATTLSSSPLVNGIIAGVKENAVLYFNALDMSIKTSEDGITFADDALSLCGFLRDGESADDVLSFIDSMHATAHRARRDAEGTLSKFREVRQGLLQISHNITQASAQVNRDRNKARNSHQRYSAVSHASTGAGNFVEAAAGILAMGVPQFSILIPTLLPPVAFVTQKIEERCAYKAGVRATQELSFADAATQLDEIRRDMEELVTHVFGFSKWWASIDSELDSLKASIYRLRPSPAQLQRVPVMQQRWGNVRDRYQGYSLQITKLQDFYPTLYLRSQPGFNAGLSVNFESTLSLLSRNTKMCQIAATTLHTSTTGDRRMTGTLRDTFDNMLVNLKLEWELLLRHLSLVLTFSHDVAEAFNFDRMDDAESMRWSVLMEELAKSSEQTADLHACVLKTFFSVKDEISYHMSTYSSRTRAAAQEVFDASVVDSSGNDTDGQTVDIRTRREAALETDGVIALSNFQATLGEIDIHLQDISSFWRARSTDFSPSNIRPPTTRVDFHLDALGSQRDFLQIDRETTNHHRECISESLDALILVVPQSPKRKRSSIGGWLRRERS